MQLTMSNKFQETVYDEKKIIFTAPLIYLNYTVKIYSHNTFSFITTGRFGKLNPLLGADDQLKTCAIRAG